MDIAASIHNLLPSGIYGGAFDKNIEAEYDALRWEDTRRKPTWGELQTAWITLKLQLRSPELEEKIEDEIANSNRAQAVQKLTDSGELPADYGSRTR